MAPLPDEKHRESIARSWRRASLAGLEPSTALRDLRAADVDPQSHLLDAAAPVLEELDDRLRGAGMLTLLVDQAGRVVHCRGDRTVTTSSDAVGVGVGASLLEEQVGTNGPGTALEMRSSVLVHGAEHFAEELRRFSCCGQPIFHPATRRLQGALDITMLGSEANPLLAQLVAKAVAEIEQRLLDGGRVSERILLAAFQAAARRTRPVLAIGDDLLLSNQAATDLLDGADLARLRNLAADLVGQAELHLELRSGQHTRVKVERVSGARGGVLVHLHPIRVPPPPCGSVRRPDTAVGHLHIAGPAGSGRSTEARTRAPGPVLTGAQAVLGGSAAWADQFTAALCGGADSICVDGVDLLPVELVELVAAHAAARQPPHLVLTSGPRETLSGPVRALTMWCAETIELLPLAHRLPELPEIAARMLADLGAGRSHHLTPGALRVLGCYDWPGNLAELRAVLAQAVRHRGAGAVLPDDLPPALAAGVLNRELAPIERAERNAIIAALRAASGNKVRAARALGVSRTTLYARMRALKVSGD